MEVSNKIFDILKEELRNKLLRKLLIDKLLKSLTIDLTYCVASGMLLTPQSSPDSDTVSRPAWTDAPWRPRC